MLVLFGKHSKNIYQWQLKPGKYTLGRSADADFIIDNHTISKLHACIEVNSDCRIIIVHDLDSHNGTIVNGRKISKATEISPGDKLIMGQVEFEILEKNQNGLNSQRSDTATIERKSESTLVLPIDEALSILPAQLSSIPEVINVISDLARIQIFEGTQPDMLRHALELISIVISADRYAVLFVDDEREEIEIAAHYYREIENEEEFLLSSTIINDIINNQSAVILTNIQDTDRYLDRESVILSGVKSAMAVPIFDEGKILGVLYTDSLKYDRNYNELYLKILAIFGNIIASRLLNYELLTKREKQKVLDTELQHAEQIQRRLLIDQMPEIDGYDVYAFLKPSLQVSGDFYDIEILPDGRILFLIADVCGKGLGAALWMSNVLASFRILYSNTDFKLKTAVERVSREMCRHSSRGNFVSLFIGLLDPETHEIRYINAGHNPPILIDKNKKTRQLEPTGTLLGIFDNYKWQEKKIKLRSDDILFLYTDGVTESKCGTEMYAETNVFDKLEQWRDNTPEEIVSLFIIDIEKFCGAKDLSDDITMLILKRMK